MKVVLQHRRGCPCSEAEGKEEGNLLEKKHYGVWNLLNLLLSSFFQVVYFKLELTVAAFEEGSYSEGKAPVLCCGLCTLVLQALCPGSEQRCIRLWATLPAGLGQTAGLWNSAPSPALPAGPLLSSQGGSAPRKVTAAAARGCAGRPGRRAEVAGCLRGRGARRGGLPAALPQVLVPRAMLEHWGHRQHEEPRVHEVPLWGGSLRSAAVAFRAEVSDRRHWHLLLGRLDRLNWGGGGGMWDGRKWGWGVEHGRWTVSSQLCSLQFLRHYAVLLAL